MNKASDERISSLMDGEVPAASETNLLKEMANADEAQQKWRHYHLIRDVLQGDFINLHTQELNDRIRGALANEPPFRQQRKLIGKLVIVVVTIVAASVYFISKYKFLMS